MHLERARVAQHLDDLARRVAAHDRVVDDDEAPAADDLRQRVELQPQAVLAQLLAGLDERARDVAVLDEAVVLRAAPLARAKPRAAGLPESGTAITRSALGAGASRARISPIRPRAACRTVPPIFESGRAK